MKWTKKTYKRELKKGYWDLEPHFHYYSLMELFGLFRTIRKEKMTIEDYKSASYGKFVCEGKPILKEFYANFNLIDKIVREINERSIKKLKEKNKKVSFYVKKKGSKRRKKVSFLSRR